MNDKQQKALLIDQPPGEVGPRTLDLDEIVREKSPSLYRRLPRLALRLASRMLYCNHINRELYELRSLPCREFPRAALDHLGVDYEIDGQQPDTDLPQPVLVANHPLGALDGLAMLSWMLNHYQEVRVPANDLLAKFPHLHPLVTPVDKFNTQRGIAKILHEAFTSPAAILVFPAGRTSRPAIVGGCLSDYPWHKMAVRMARIHQRPIIPVFINGRNSRLFYALYHLRRWFRIQTNLEMFLLVKEMMHPATRRVGLHFGRAIQPAELERLGSNDKERMRWIRAACYRNAPARATFSNASTSTQIRWSE